MHRTPQRVARPLAAETRGPSRSPLHNKRKKKKKPSAGSDAALDGCHSDNRPRPSCRFRHSR